MPASTHEITSRGHALAMDARDPLAHYRDMFHISDPTRCYLDGNSLGRLPKRTIELVNHYLLNEWGDQIVDGWSSWIDEAQSTGNLIGRAALGAAAGQVLAVDTTSVNFYQLCHAAIEARPGRRTVISDASNFPTDRYILEGLCQRLGLKLVLIADEDDGEFVTSKILEPHLHDDVALVTLSVVQYRSGALHDVAAITDLVHGVGALMLWDASHAIGVVPLQFDRDGVDLAVGCSYKYGNSGPGSPGWLYVRHELQNILQVPIQGWFAQDDQFAMAPGFLRARGIRGFQVASPSIIGLRCVQAAFEMIDDAGLVAIADKAAKGTELMLVLHDAWLAQLGCTVVTPRDSARRGGHVTIRHPEARRISASLRRDANVVADFRQPDCVRLAISPLATSYVDIWEGFNRLRELITTKTFEQIGEPTSRVT
ncbi:MAG: aminotransferase class V-fold PLP-dependent enzyme [Ilumatobacteraceae bacterium]